MHEIVQYMNWIAIANCTVGLELSANNHFKGTMRKIDDVKWKFCFFEKVAKNAFSKLFSSNFFY